MYKIPWSLGYPQRIRRLGSPVFPGEPALFPAKRARPALPKPRRERFSFVFVLLCVLNENSRFQILSASGVDRDDRGPLREEGRPADSMKSFPFRTAEGAPERQHGEHHELSTPSKPGQFPTKLVQIRFTAWWNDCSSPYVPERDQDQVSCSRE